MNQQENFHNFNVLFQWIESFSLPLGIFLQGVSQSRIRDFVERTDLSWRDYVNTLEYWRGYTITNPCPDSRSTSKSLVLPICLDIAWPQRQISLTSAEVPAVLLHVSYRYFGFLYCCADVRLDSVTWTWAPGATRDASANPALHTGWPVIISRASLVVLGILTQVNKIWPLC